MSTINKNKYSVVQFKDLPYDNIGKYIIIPYSWIRIRRSSGTIQVAFPKEDPNITRKRVKKNQTYRETWQLYEAIVKYDSSKFKEADDWISNTKNGQTEIERFVIEAEKKSNSPDDSKNDAVAANNNALITNRDATKEANKHILQLPKKRYRNIDVEETFSTSEVNKPEMKITPLKSDKTEGLRLSKLQFSSRSGHHSIESKSPIVNDGHSHGEPQRLSPPSINNPQPTVQKVPVLMNQHDQVSEQSSEKLYPKTFDDQQQQQQRHSPTQIPFSQSVITKDPRSGEDHIKNPRSTTSPVQCYPKIEDQTSRRSPELRPVLPNYSHEVPRSQGFLSAGSSERIPFNEVTKNTPPPVQDLSNQSKKSPKSKLIVRGAILQDPTTEIFFIRRANNFCVPKKVTVQDTTVKSSSSEQNLPPSECKSASCYTDCILTQKSVEKCFPDDPTITENPVRSTLQNILSQKKSIIHCKCKRVVRKRTSSPTRNQSCEPVSKKQFSDALDNSSDQDTLTKEIPVEKLNYPNHDKSSNGSECNPQCVLTKENNFRTTTKMSIDSKEMAEKMLTNEFDTIVKKIDKIIDNSNEAVFTVRNALYECVRAFQNVIRDANNYSEFRIKELKSLKKPQTTPAVSSSPEDTTVTRGNNQQNGNNDNYDEEATKTMKKPCSFILPSDYDPNDTRWTLKYQVPGPGIIELIPHSNIYIKVHRLAYCKRVARDCETLARMLLTEIFSISALSVCSLTGARAKAFDLDGSDVRPGLDEHARSVLLISVKEYGIKNRWRVFDTQSILNSIRSKIQEIRSKYGFIVQ